MSVVSIYNQALNYLGLEQVKSVSDPTKSAKTLTSSYSIARDEVLRAHPWACLKVTVDGELEDDLDWEDASVYIVGDYCVVGTSLYRCITAGTSDATAFTESTNQDITDGSVHWKYLEPVENNTSWLYRYLIPTRTLRILKVGDGVQFERQGRWLYTDEEDATITLVIASENPDDWDAYIQDAIALKLAGMVGMTLGADPSVVQVLKSEYRVALDAAQALSSGESSEEPDHDTMWVDV